MKERMERPRRLRTSEGIRGLVKETRLNRASLIYPLFVAEGTHIKEEIASMPGVYHYSLDRLQEEIAEVVAVGISAVLLFGVPLEEEKNGLGTSAYEPEGIVQRAVKCIKKWAPQLVVMTDVCMCGYTCHGHCGVVDEDGYVDNDKTLGYLSKIAVSHARAGADFVSPSDMMDGRVGAIRGALDEAGYKNVGIMAYSAKYASHFYGPFREAAHSAPGFGDRRSYQMDYANAREAIREGQLDVIEGADLLMVKPASTYLDIIYRFKESFMLPIVAYQVSGEYSMLKLAISQGILSEQAIEESLIAIKRAGADLIITYFAKEIALTLNN